MLYYKISDESWRVINLSGLAVVKIIPVKPNIGKGLNHAFVENTSTYISKMCLTWVLYHQQTPCIFCAFFKWENLFFSLHSTGTCKRPIRPWLKPCKNNYILEFVYVGFLCSWTLAKKLTRFFILEEEEGYKWPSWQTCVCLKDLVSWNLHSVFFFASSPERFPPKSNLWNCLFADSQVSKMSAAPFFKTGVSRNDVTSHLELCQ